MVAPLSFLAITYLLTTPSTSRNNRSRFSPSTKKENGTTGRSRYSRGGNSENTGRRRNRRTTTPNQRHRNDDNNDNQSLFDSRQDLPPPPPLTTTLFNQPLPSYFTCRHTYEETLIQEIRRTVAQKSASKITEVTILSPSPGLVRVERASEILPQRYDPVYALQSIPDAVVVSAESIKTLAREVYNGVLQLNSGDDDDAAAASNNTRAINIKIAEELRSAPRGSLSIHALVPGMFKGQKSPIMQRRADKIADELKGMLQKGFAAARKATKQDANSEESEKWILQIMLVTPEVAVASLTKCEKVGPKQPSSFGGSSGTVWPNWNHPAGLANVDLEGDDIPSSAYRKLMEALECMRCHPPSAELYPSTASWVVDLGASPGGWTAALRRMGCKIIAVDRSELAPNLMKDEMVRFVKGDAFTYIPEVSKKENNLAPEDDTWMVSDVIAYPERVAELLDRWCGGRWASHMVVTVKFRGETPAWSELEHAIDIARGHGYECRAKHFFNNKNEVTLMVGESRGKRKEGSAMAGAGVRSVGLLGKPMYPVTLPSR